ncbi:MAG: Trk system potassium transporter TrkA [Bacteroidaceae bacterium]|jgi:trk system potassium uptake protein TrkA
MKIVIAGAGAVGTHLAKLLASENQDIILLDENPALLGTLEMNFDLMTLSVSPTSVIGLEEAGVSNADLFIAVTPNESQNMTACMLAANLGAKKTVARIDNQEYLMPRNRDFFARVGVHSLIYPEILAAQEIISSVRMSWIRQWWEFSDGALLLLGVKIREGAEILDKPLHTLGTDVPYHLVAIKRDNDTIIPSGNDMVKLNDIVYFTTTRKYIPYIREIAGKENFPDVRNIIIMGGSRIAIRAAQLAPDYMKIKIIERDREKSQFVANSVSDKIMVINGDGRDMELLAREGIYETDAFVSLTDSSETNILACSAVKRMGVQKTVAEVENIDYISMAESMDIGSVINKKIIAASHIYQMMLDSDVNNVKSLTFSNADVAEFTVHEGDKITKKPVKDLGLPKGTTIGGLVRNKKGIMVSGDTRILPDDHVIVFCLGGSALIKKIERFFQ